MGGGSYGKDILNILYKYSLGKHIMGFCDSDENKYGIRILDLEIQSYEIIKEKYGEVLFLVCSTYCKEIMEFLKSKLEKDENIKLLTEKYIRRECASIQKFYPNENLNYLCVQYERIDKSLFNTNYNLMENILYDDKSIEVANAIKDLRIYGHWRYMDKIDIDEEQYFLKSIYNIGNDEIFVDLGAFDGDTIFKFLKVVNNNYKKIIAFEPDSDNYKNLIVNLSRKNLENITTFNLATWKEKGELYFKSNLTGSQINDNGVLKVNVDSLDNLLLNIPVTFIKMDIEGAEKETILGAKNLIKKYKPKLAICVYHKFEDIYEIPLMIKNLVPEYKIYLRHHSVFTCETVCYACV